MQRKPRCRERALMRTTAFNHSKVKENKAPKKLQTETLQNMKDKHVAGWRLRLKKKRVRFDETGVQSSRRTRQDTGVFLRTSASHESGEALSCRPTKKCLRFGASRWSEATLGNISEAISKREKTHAHTYPHTHAQLLLIPSSRSKCRAATEGKGQARIKASNFFILFYFFYFLNGGIEPDSRVRLHRLLRSYPSKPYSEVYAFMRPTLDSLKRIKVSRSHIWRLNCSVYDFMTKTHSYVWFVTIHCSQMNVSLISLLLGHQRPKQTCGALRGSDAFPVLSATFCDSSDFLSSPSFFVSSTRTGCTDHFHLFHVTPPPPPFLCTKGAVYAPLTRKDPFRTI